VTGYFRGRGAQGITLSSDRTGPTLEVPVRAVHRILATQLLRYGTAPGASFHAPARPPQLQGSLTGPVSSVTGRSNPLWAVALAVTTPCPRCGRPGR
jgi:hypothetical protein